jgi:peptidoglycan/LPS O-acetylase OafA/YrhL
MSAQDNRLAHLDGVRAIAVLAVILEHSIFGRNPTEFFGVFSAGPFGVRLFFVLSGFLITGILLDARSACESTGGSRVGVWLAFYGRRALRIFPLAYLAIALVILAGDPVVREQLGWYLGYLTNVLAAKNETFDASTIRHFWSLAVEEQFYLLWPSIVLLVPVSALGTTIGAGIAAAFAFRTFLVATGHPVAAYVLLPSRMDSLLVGALLAWGLRRGWSQTTATRACLLGAAVLFVVGPSATRETVGILLSAGIVLWAASGPRRGVGKLLAHPVAVWVGSISYGVYVYHFLIANVLRMLSVRYGWPALSPPYYGATRLVWMLATTFPVAAASWYLIEKPLNDLKRYIPYVRRTQQTSTSESRDVMVAG